MKILITNHRLSDRTGSELFAAEMAESLRVAGHQVCLFSSLVGALANQIRSDGVSVVTDPSECPFIPDLIHGQHHLETMAALAAWPDTPGIYFAHGSTPWEEHPPAHPRILRYLGTSPRFAWWIARECDVPESSIGVIRNYFDPSQFPTVGSPKDTARRALVFHHTMDPQSEAFAAIREGCETAGWTLDVIGAGFGSTVSSPGAVLPTYALVFAGGRSAIEAMASGAAVIPINATKMASLVTPDTFDSIRDLNFCADSNDPTISVARIEAELGAWDPSKAIAVTHRLRSEATRGGAVTALLGHYREAVEAFANGPNPDAQAESQAMARYLLTLTRKVKEVDEKRALLAAKWEQSRSRADKWAERASAAEGRIEWLEAEMEKPSLLGWRGRLWRRLRRQWETDHTN